MSSENPSGESGTGQVNGGNGEIGGLDRREFMRSALAVGGAGALSSALSLGGVPDVGTAQDDGTAIGFGERSNRQHAWRDYQTVVESKGIALPPSHNLALHVDYLKEGAPTAGDRRTVEAAFRELERRFDWDEDGLLFKVGYTTKYFERFGRTDRSFEVDGEEYNVKNALKLPKGLVPKLWIPIDGKPTMLSGETLINLPGVTLDREDPVADDYDAVIIMASNDVRKLLMAEQMLWDDYDPDIVWESRSDGIAPEPLANTFNGIFSKPESFPARRIGFSGHKDVKTRLRKDTDFNEEQIPNFGEDRQSNLLMGINDIFKNSNPQETDVTMLEDQKLVNPKPPGAFAQGTVMHFSDVRVKLGDFYGDHGIAGRRKRLLSANSTRENTGLVGEDLGTSNAPGAEKNLPARDISADTDLATRTVEDFENKGVTGHAQKCARARFDLETRITDEGRTRLSGDGRGERLPAEERQDSLPGHDGVQEAEPVMLRRDVAGTSPIEPGGRREPSNGFLALMRFAPYMAYMRRAMNGVEFDTADFGLTGDARLQHEAIGDNPDSGIVNYMDTKRRQNYLVPPLTMRSLPHPNGETVEFSIAPAGPSEYAVTVRGLGPSDFEDGSVQFGWYYDVNRQRGATPTEVRGDEGSNATIFVFPAEDTGIDSAPGGDNGSVRVRLAGRRADSLRPVRGTLEFQPPILPDLPGDVKPFDTDGDGRIEVNEVVDTVSAYRNGETIDGDPVSARDVLKVVAQFNA